MNTQSQGMRAALWTLGLLLIAGTAQAATLNGSTWAEPDGITVSYDLERGDDGEWTRPEQTFTLHWDLTLECEVPTASPGSDFPIGVDGAGELAISQGDEKTIIFDLEPREVTAQWTRDGPTDAWNSEGTQTIRIVNEQASPIEQEIEYRWFANVNIPNADCAGNELDGGLDFQNHTIFLPKLEAGEPFDDEGPTTRGVPVAALPMGLALVGLAALKKR